MKQLKIKKEFWILIINGEKQYEFRKLSKNLPSGVYEFIDIDTKEILGTADLRRLKVDKKTLNWVKENYIAENIGFLGYEISNVKDVRMNKKKYCIDKIRCYAPELSTSNLNKLSKKQLSYLVNVIRFHSIYTKTLKEKNNGN